MAWYHRLLNLTRGDDLSHDLDREMQFHIAERAEQLVAQGMSAEDAQREARRVFGHVQRQKEDTRDADIIVWLESLGADIRYALRALRLSPGFTIIAVLSLGLGVGANTAIFSLINAVMLKSLPVSHPEELVTVNRVEINAHGERDAGGSFTNPLWEQIRDHVDVLDAFAYSTLQFNLANGGEARRINGSWVTGGYFPVLGARPLAGRLLSRADDVRGCPGVAVVGAGFAAREYGSAPGAVGRSVSLDGHPFEIVGVTEAAFFGVDVGNRMEVYAPLCAEAILRGKNSGLDHRSFWFLQILARPRGSLTDAQMQMRLARAAPAINAATVPANWKPSDQANYLRSTLGSSPAATGFSELRTQYRDALFALMVVVGVVLLIACANVAHLLLARAATRQREMAVRMAIGAGRGRLVRQLLTESVLLALLGSAVGVAFARWASSLMISLLPTRGLGVWLDLSLDLRVLGFTIGVAMLTGVLFGLAPAWRTARTAPHLAMQGHSRSVAGARTAVTKGLVVGQVALSLVLLVAAGLLLRSFQKLATLDPGFDRHGVLVASMDLENAGYPDSQRVVVYGQLLERMRGLPGVRSASASLITPISGTGWNEFVTADGFVPKGERDALIWFNAVSDGYFATLRTRIVAGRDFGPQDVAGGPKVAAINETMARRVFGSANPIGRTFRVPRPSGSGPAIEVIAVVQDAKYGKLSDGESPTGFFPLGQSELWGTSLNFALRTDGDPAALIGPVKNLAHEFNRAISLDLVTLEDQVAGSLARPRLLATLSAFFGALALLLATVGLYGTVAYSVAQRHHEIGIRIALGAERSRVVRMILGEVGRLMTAGALLGVAISLAATRLLASFLYDLTATDPATLVFAVAALAAVAIAAGAVPAWRAARLDPMAALREE